MAERTPWRRMALVAAVLAAVAVRLLTPVGWMPNPNGIGPLVICTAEGPRLAGGVDLPSHGPDHSPAHEHCLFSGFSMVDEPDFAFVPQPRERFVADAGKPVFERAAWRSREQHRRQFPRGPPRASDAAT